MTGKKIIRKKPDHWGVGDLVLGSYIFEYFHDRKRKGQQHE